MNNFDTLFPNFLSQCAEMNRVLMPIAFVLLAIGIVSSTVTGHRSPSAYLRTIGRTFAFAAVLAYLPTWNNEIASVVDTTVKETLKADPAGVYAQYQKALQITKGTSSSGSGSITARPPRRPDVRGSRARSVALPSLEGGGLLGPGPLGVD